jgi:hypothetical protein
MKKILSVLLIQTALFSIQAQAASLWDTLTPVQKSALQRGEQVSAVEAVAGKSWPKVTLYQLIHATAEEGAAVFADFEKASSFVPDLKKSVISRREGPSVIHVDYTLKLPLVADENYTIRNTISTYTARGTAYSIDWKLVRADTTRDTVGFARFESVGTETLFVYHNFVTPAPGLSDMLKKRAIRQVATVAKAFAQRIEKVRVSEPALLQKQLEALRVAVLNRRALRF